MHASRVFRTAKCVLFIKCVIAVEYKLYSVGKNVVMCVCCSINRLEEAESRHNIESREQTEVIGQLRQEVMEVTEAFRGQLHSLQEEHQRAMVSLREDLDLSRDTVSRLQQVCGVGGCEWGREGEGEGEGEGGGEGDGEGGGGRGRGRGRERGGGRERGEEAGW